MIVDEYYIHLVWSIDFPFGPGSQKNIVINRDMLARTMMCEEGKE